MLTRNAETIDYIVSGCTLLVPVNIKLDITDWYEHYPDPVIDIDAATLLQYRQKNNQR